MPTNRNRLSPPQVNVYVTNAGQKLVNLDKKLDWNRAFKAYLKKLDKIKPVISCGDFNCAHEEIDLANPKTNHKTAGFTPEERSGKLADFITRCSQSDALRPILLVGCSSNALSRILLVRCS